MQRKYHKISYTKIYQIFKNAINFKDINSKKKHIIYNIHHSLNLKLKENLLTLEYTIINIFNIKRNPEAIVTILY